MTRINFQNNLFAVFTIFTCVFGLFAYSDDVPAVLPDPDGKKGNASKPVKVYILAGQSNMVGMGNLSGAKNMYSGVYLSSDPAIAGGPFQIYKVGNFKVSPITTYQSNGSLTKEPIAEGSFEVPLTGEYRVHCGYQQSSFCKMKMGDTTVYNRKPNDNSESKSIQLKAGTKYKFKISGFDKTPPRFWLEQTDLLGYGDLEAVSKREGKFPWLVDGKGNWTVRHDVYFQEARLAKEGKGSALSATSNGKAIGPELGFGHVLGTFHDEQVLLIKTAQGNRSLGFDFRPPSSGRTAPDNEFESAEYKLMIEGVRKTLTNIDKVVPGYQGQGYEIAGFAWFQGHKDSFDEKQIKDYEKNLVNLIKDVRAEFKKPKLPVVVATVGFGGHKMQEKFQRIHSAQINVGDSSKHPELAKSVRTVDTRNFWREVDESPANQDYHYHRNAETYMLIGDSMGRAMVRLQGGSAATLPLAQQVKRKKNESTAPLTEAQKEASRLAMRPIIIDGIANSYANNPRYAKQLAQEINMERPDRFNQFLRGSMFGLTNCYEAAGVTDYAWKPFGPDLDRLEWDYFSFDPPEKLDIKKGKRFRKVTYPEKMSDWTSKSFDPTNAGWKKGLQPFGQLDGKLAPLSESCTARFCRCGEQPKTLWEKEVLMIRGTVELPPFKKGHRYRVVVGGAAHVNSGEGYAIYLNGELLAESATGVAVRQGGQPRGAHIYSDFLNNFEGGKVTVAATSFLRFNHPRRGVQPPRGNLSIKIEEQKIPDLE